MEPHHPNATPTARLPHQLLRLPPSGFPARPRHPQCPLGTPHSHGFGTTHTNPNRPQLTDHPTNSHPTRYPDNTTPRNSNCAPPSHRTQSSSYPRSSTTTTGQRRHVTTQQNRHHHQPGSLPQTPGPHHGRPQQHAGQPKRDTTPATAYHPKHHCRRRPHPTQMAMLQRTMRCLTHTTPGRIPLRTHWEPDALCMRGFPLPKRGLLMSLLC